MAHYIQVLKEYTRSQNPDCCDGASVLAMLYTCYSESNRMEDEKIRADFDELYHKMNGMPLKEMDRVIYAVCTLCRDHEESGFIHGMQVGVRLANEIRNEKV